MGACGSSLSEEQIAQKKKNRELERDIKNTKEVEDSKIKLLLLGAGESGKSTVFKQMRILYGDIPFTKEDGMALKPTIANNICHSMKTLCENCEILNTPDGASVMELVQDKKSLEFIKTIDPDQQVLDDNVARALKSCWADPGIQMTWEMREHFQIVDSVKSYFDDLERICNPNYEPTEPDCLLARVRTSGIVEEVYKIDGVDFVMYDVGGQRNERKKWIHCFEEVTAVIFVAAISEYNQFLYEDQGTNRMDEALELFAEICNSKWFNKSSMILFLNKKDLLWEKMCKFPIQGACNGKYMNFPRPGVSPMPVAGSGVSPFQDANGKYLEEDDHKAASPDFYEWMMVTHEYWKNEFRTLNLRPDSPPELAMFKEITEHVTCATDTQGVKRVFEVCKEVILKGNLAASGFMD